MRKYECMWFSLLDMALLARPHLVGRPLFLLSNVTRVHEFKKGPTDLQKFRSLYEFAVLELSFWDQCR